MGKQNKYIITSKQGGEEEDPQEVCRRGFRGSAAEAEEGLQERGGPAGGDEEGLQEGMRRACRRG